MLGSLPSGIWKIKVNPIKFIRWEITIGILALVAILGWKLSQETPPDWGSAKGQSRDYCRLRFGEPRRVWRESYVGATEGPLEYWTYFDHTMVFKDGVCVQVYRTHGRDDARSRDDGVNAWEVIKHAFSEK